MPNHKKQLVLTILVMLAAVILTACQQTTAYEDPPLPGINVAITSNLCPNIETEEGQQVTWINDDNIMHIVRDISNEGSGQFDSGELQPGNSFMFTFLQPGTYTYVCSADGAMTGTIIVQP